MNQTISYQEIAIAPSASSWLTGARVMGAQISLTPASRPVADTWEDWRKLHSVWRGKSRKEVERHPHVQAYRSFYTQMGLDPGRTPPSVQVLVQRFLRDEVLSKIPSIHPIVDAVNIAAVETMIPLGVFDARRVSGEIVIDLSRGVEPFRPIGAQETTILAQGLVILRDDEKVLSQFCHRDADAQKITDATDSVWLLGCQVSGIREDEVMDALSRAIALLGRNFAVQPWW
jgi:DNA/RNA-binding domain of Phe-tRNA-synthetase-like protein